MSLRYNIVVLIVVVIGAVACDKDDVSMLPSSGAISFRESELTRGAIGEEASMTNLGVYAFYTGAQRWAASATSQKTYMQNTKVEREITYGVDGTTIEHTSEWHYTPLKYWPASSAPYLTFFAFSPRGEVRATTDPTKYDYTMEANAMDNCDLAVASEIDATGEEYGESGVNLAFEHALTRISVWAAYTNDYTTQEYEDRGEKGVKYYLNGITLYGLYSEAELQFNTDGTWRWVVNNAASSPKVDCTATRGNTLQSDPLSDVSSWVTEENEDIFILPQTLHGDAYMQLRIRKTYYNLDEDMTITTIDPETGEETVTEVPPHEMIYASEDLEIPTKGRNTFNVKDWLKYSFTFDVQTLSEYNTPMTLTSEVLPWNEVDIPAEINKNIYIYSSDNRVEMQSDSDGDYGDFQVCTNYGYDLRVPHYHVELDGTITATRGFLFCTDDFPDSKYPYTSEVNKFTISDGTEYKVFIPTLLSTEDVEYKYTTKADLKGADKANVQYIGWNGLETRLMMIYYSSNAYDDNMAFAYMIDPTTKIYRQIYRNPNNPSSVVAFNYDEDGEIDLTEFEREDGTVHFKITIGNITNNRNNQTLYSLAFAAKKSTRTQEGLYVSSAIQGEDDSYGVNKKGTDPVYNLKLGVDKAHMTDGEFDDALGVQMVSNGGGAIMQLFPVTLYDPNYTTD